MSESEKAIESQRFVASYTVGDDCGAILLAPIQESVGDNTKIRISIADSQSSGQHL